MIKKRILFYHFIFTVLSVFLSVGLLSAAPSTGNYSADMVEGVIEEAAEGIWGSGPMIQEMEKGTRGKRWFTDGTTNKDGTKKVLTGSACDIHAEEGIGAITVDKQKQPPYTSPLESNALSMLS